MPGGTLASWAALPALSWIQIVLVVALLDNSVLAQDPSKEPGDVGDGTYCQPGKVWVRYADVPGFSGKEFKLNAERNNGRAAMMGIIGMMIHEGLTGNPVWPIPVPPQPGGPRRDPSTRTRHASRTSREKPPTPVRAVPQSSTLPRTTLKRARRASARSSSPRWAWRSSASPPPSPSSAAVRTRPWASYTTPHNQTDHSWHVVLSDVSLIYTPRNLLPGQQPRPVGWRRAAHALRAAVPLYSLSPHLLNVPVRMHSGLGGGGTAHSLHGYSATRCCAPCIADGRA